MKIAQITLDGFYNQGGIILHRSSGISIIRCRKQRKIQSSLNCEYQTGGVLILWLN